MSLSCWDVLIKYYWDDKLFFIYLNYNGQNLNDVVKHKVLKQCGALIKKYWISENYTIYFFPLTILILFLILMKGKYTNLLNGCIIQ